MEPIKIEQVSSVYSGRDGKCCCGCSGKHRYASAHREWAGENRGYKVSDEDVSDRSVKLLVNKMNAHLGVAYCEGDHYVLVLGQRLYLAYLKI